MVFFIVLVFSVVMKIRSLSKSLKNIASNSFIFDIMISLSLFLLLVNTNTIIDIFDNSNGYFMVYIEDVGITNSTDYLVFYNSDCKEINHVKMNKRGRLNISNDEKQIIVRYNNYEVHFDYYGNELDNDISLDSFATRIYTPYSNFSEIRRESNFLGYEYISVKNDYFEKKIHPNNIFYLRKLFMALFISVVIFALLKRISYVICIHSAKWGYPPTIFPTNSKELRQKRPQLCITMNDYKLLQLQLTPPSSIKSSQSNRFTVVGQTANHPVV